MTDSLYEAYTFIKPRKEGGKEQRLNIGVGFANDDGTFSIYLNAYPVNAKITLVKKERHAQIPSLAADFAER